MVRSHDGEEMQGLLKSKKETFWRESKRCDENEACEVSEEVVDNLVGVQT